MNQTQLQSLKQEVQQDPKQLGYAALLPNQPGRVVELLNNQGLGDTKYATKLIGIANVLAALGPETGAQVLNQLEALKAANPVIKWAWYLLESDKLDVGSATTQQQLDMLVAAGALAGEHAQKLKDLSKVACSRAQLVVGTQVTEEDLRKAME